MSPLVLVAVATTLLFLQADTSDLYSILRAAMGVALLFAVFVRQAGMIVDLMGQVSQREDQISMIADVVTALSGPAPPATVLKPALSRIVSGLDADVALVCQFPTSAQSQPLFEQVGLPDPERCPELVQELAQNMLFCGTGMRTHSQVLPGQPADQPPAHCITTRVGRRAEDNGLLLVARWGAPFNESEIKLLAAIGSDIAGRLLKTKLLAAQQMVDCDPLTGLFNHRVGFEKLQAEVVRHEETGRPVSALLFDLDGFKRFNDTYGYGAGDKVLVSVATSVSGLLRDGDVVARYGGDELLVILPGTTPETAVRCAERVQARIVESASAELGIGRVPIYACCGIGNCPHDSNEALELIAIADGNLMTAKHRGTGQIGVRTVSVVPADVQPSEHMDLLRSLVIAVDNKDRYTRRHSEEVAAYAVDIGRAMNLPQPELDELYTCGLIHDLGKIGVPDRILSKPGKLSLEEVRIMQQHAVIGGLIAGSLPGMEQVVPGVRHHHEHFDGRGYPDGLSGGDIPQIARILAVADVYSALTTDRPYRRGMPPEKAIHIIEQNAGSQFDPEIAGVFVRMHASQAS